MKGKTNPSQNRKRKVNPNQNHQNQRKQQKVSNYQQQQQQRGNWSDYQPVVTTNRGRGINAQSNGYQQNQFHSQNGGPNNGYRSYHTQGGNQRGNFQNNGPYRRQQNFKQSRNLPPVRNGYSKENRGQNQSNQNGYQFSNKRANYYKMKNAANGKANNGNFKGNGYQQNGKFNGQRNGKFNGKFKGKFNRQQQQNGNGYSFNNGKLPSAADLDKDLDSYLMKNPNAEDRVSTISNHLDKELDDYFKGQPDEEAAKE